MPFIRRMPILETPRLTIRPFTPDDLDAAHHLLDEDLQWAGQVSKDQRQDLLHFHAALTRWPLTGGIYGDRAICLTVSGSLIGMCGLRPWLCTPEERGVFDPDQIRRERSGHQLELGVGYGIASAYRRQGYATEAVRALLDYGLTVLHVSRLFALTGRGNAVSVAVMRAVGMQVGFHPDATVNFPWAVGRIDYVVVHNLDRAPSRTSPL